MYRILIHYEKYVGEVGKCISNCSKRHTKQYKLKIRKLNFRDDVDT